MILIHLGATLNCRGCGAGIYTAIKNIGMGESVDSEGNRIYPDMFTEYAVEAIPPQVQHDRGQGLPFPPCAHCGANDFGL